WQQRHVKRLLAYSTVAHTGLFLIGIGLLRPEGLLGEAAVNGKKCPRNRGYVNRSSDSRRPVYVQMGGERFTRSLKYVDRCAG
ncbi:proton-conducting transporter membrane subunit, partial [Streptomyces sp. NPDC079189]|uniref:proton-conducting transporter transmembrane domain-containing protein n=1 Tax=Streptomyces sp. NPDC079189 TaxID=3154514 RepID=UPI00344A5249